VIRSSPKTRARKRMIAALDADCRERVVWQRDREICQRCGIQNGAWIEELGRYAQIQWCHVHTREYYVTRWEADNSLALCDRCHVFFDNHKVLSFEWFRKTWPERWQNIQNVLQSGTKTSDAWIRSRFLELKGDKQ
jgi:5-methylcytosine-specific restriction endonuclease McrA